MANMKSVARNLIRSSRKYCTTSWEEIKIPVPWGHIAAKWWGPKGQQPILASHGWQDNCGTYDTLIPMLPKSISFLTYDFPGHGMSSRLPPGSFYHSIDGPILIKHIIEYFNWSRVTLMGHSLGSAINVVYTMLFPESVNFLVCLDSLKPHIPTDLINRQRKAIDDFLKYEYLESVNSKQPAFTFKEIEHRLHEGTRKQIALDACKYILNRNISPSLTDSNKVYFARDPRLKTYNLINWSQKDIINNLNRLTCPIFLYLASRCPAFEPKILHVEAIEELKKLNKRFEVYYVDGTHHVHLNNPERVAGLITSFLYKYHDKESCGDRNN